MPNAPSGRRRLLHLRRVRVEIAVGRAALEGLLILNDLSAGRIDVFLSSPLPLEQTVQVRIGMPWNLEFSGTVAALHKIEMGRNVLSPEKYAFRVGISLNLDEEWKRKQLEDFFTELVNGRILVTDAA